MVNVKNEIVELIEIVKSESRPIENHIDLDAYDACWNELIRNVKLLSDDVVVYQNPHENIRKIYNQFYGFDAIIESTFSDNNKDVSLEGRMLFNMWKAIKKDLGI